MPAPTRRWWGRLRIAWRMVAIALLAVAAVSVGLAFTAGPALAAPAPVPSPAPAAPSPVTPGPIPGPPTTGPTSSPAAPDATPGSEWDTPSSDDPGPGFFDIPGQIRQALNDFFAWVARTGLKPVLDTLGSTILATPDLTSNAQVKAIWTTCLVIANALFVLFVIAGGFITASRNTLQSRYGVREILPRIVIAGIAANCSLLLCDKVIEVVNAVTAAIAGQGVDGPTAAAAIGEVLTAQANGTGFLLSLLVLAVLVMAIVVVSTFILRIVAFAVLIGVAPLALICHATPYTEGLAYTWWRAVAACGAIQVGQAVILLATVTVFLTPNGGLILGIPATSGGLLGILVCLTTLWLLIKLPGWTRVFVLGPLGNGPGLLRQIIGTVLMVKTLGTAVGVIGGASSGRPAPAPRAPAATPVGRAPARPAPTPTGKPGRRAPAVPGRPVRPAAPAQFSHAPVAQTPLPQPAGDPSPPAFSSPNTPTPPRPASGALPPAQFSHQPAAQPPAPAAARSRPTAARFSDASTPTATPATSVGPVRRPPAGAAFSSAPAGQSAPKRPPAPLTPAFSHSPTPPSPRRPQAPPRRTTTGAAPPPAATPAPIPPATTRARSARPTPPPVPRSAPTRTSPPRPAPPPAASAPPAATPPIPPPARRRPVRSDR